MRRREQTHTWRKPPLRLEGKTADIDFGSVRFGMPVVFNAPRPMPSPARIPGPQSLASAKGLDSRPLLALHRSCRARETRGARTRSRANSVTGAVRGLPRPHNPTPYTLGRPPLPRASCASLDLGEGHELAALDEAAVVLGDAGDGVLDGLLGDGRSAAEFGSVETFSGRALAVPRVFVCSPGPAPRSPHRQRRTCVSMAPPLRMAITRSLVMPYATSMRSNLLAHVTVGRWSPRTAFSMSSRRGV
jgi:hypothetical protein